MSFDELGALIEESWLTLDQMMDNTSKWGFWQKILNFDCMWATVDFWPSTIDFQAFEQLAEQTSSTRLETWHGWSWEHIRTNGEHLSPLWFTHLDEDGNPNLSGRQKRKTRSAKFIMQETSNVLLMIYEKGQIISPHKQSQGASGKASGCRV